jgi:xanthine dehydrogenase accessory factor
MNEITLWKFILERLDRSEPVMLMCVVESHGSSPGRRGFKMAVARDEMSGSIGGGVMEHKFVELAKEKLKEESAKTLLRNQKHNKTAAKDQSGMICSGEQTIVLFRVNTSHAKSINSLIDSLESFQSGTLELTESDLNFYEKTPGEIFFFKGNEEKWLYRQQTGCINHLYIIGGGHCSLALSQLMSSMDFIIHVFDERKDLNTLMTNRFAHEKTILNDYTQLGSKIDSGENNYVVIMTFGYRTDDIALRSLLEKDFKYIGVLGSKAKMEKMFSEWRSDGLQESKLKLLHAPIGISINSETPMEIAVSIAAEIIAVKNSVDNHNGKS